MEMRFGDWCLEVDRQTTKAYYDSAAREGEGCDCVGCRNFRAAVERLPPEVGAFFASLGADVTKVREVCIPFLEKNGLLWYMGFTHVSGFLLEGGEKYHLLWQAETGEKGEEAEMFQVGFCTCCDMLDTAFPRPAMQIDFSARLPWVLPEENDYD